MAMTWNSVMGIALLLMGAAAAEAKTALWLHIKVHDGNDDSRVSVNLPLSVVEAASPLIPEEARTAGSLRVDGRDLSVQDLRRIWREVQRLPDAAYITVDEQQGKVRVARSGGYLLIQAAHQAASEGSGRHRGEHVEARIPAAVVDALLKGSGDRFDLAAAIEALAQSGEGELVTVNGDHQTVRMWVDGAADGR
jgi:phosphohistidine swiveling domain-containing protein